MKTSEKQLTKAITIPIHILENLAVIALALDMETYEVLYGNGHARNTFGDILGKECWSVLQKDQTGPCYSCPNSRLLTPDGMPLPPRRRTCKSPLNNRWYEITEVAVRGENRRLVKIVIAVDITDEKQDGRKSVDKCLTCDEKTSDPENMIMMCCNCHKIRGEKGEWNHPAVYIHRRLAVQVSHGICSACARELYPEID